MFYEKKKKVYSEVSDTNKNINSDYFNIFQYELKKMFHDNTETNNVETKNIELTNDEMKNDKIKNIKLTNEDIVFINLFSKYIKNK